MLLTIATVWLAFSLLGAADESRTQYKPSSDQAILPVGRLSSRNVTYAATTCTEADLAPGGFFGYNTSYKERFSSEYRSPRCEAFWADPENSERKNQLKRGILPATIMMTDVEHSQTLNVRRMKRVLQKLATPGEHVHITVFGGSLTAGANVNGVEGAWPKTLTNSWNWLGEEAKAINGLGANMLMKNLAVGGTSSQWLLHRLGSFIEEDDLIDLVILDYDVNDAMMVWDTKDDHENSMTEIELLVRRLLQLPQKVAVLYMNTAITHGRGSELHARCNEYHTCWQVDVWKKPLFHAYGVPMVSQRDAIWTDFSCPPSISDWDCTKSHCAHPGWTGHELMAQLIFSFFSWGVEKFSNSSASAREWVSDDLDDKLQEQLFTTPFLMSRGARLNESICLYFEASVDHVNSAFVALDFEHKQTLNEDALGEGIQSALDHGGARIQEQKDRHRYNGVKLMQINPSCWGFHEDVPGRKDKLGWVGEADTARRSLRGSLFQGSITETHRATTSGTSCFGAHITFQLRIGTRERLLVTALMTYDKHAGMTEVSISPPLSDQQITDGYLSPDESFERITTIDGFHDAEGSPIIPIIIDNEFRKIHRNTTQQVRITLLDANTEGFGYRNRFERRIPRLYPQKVKLEALSSC